MANFKAGINMYYVSHALGKQNHITSRIYWTNWRNQL